MPLLGIRILRRVAKPTPAPVLTGSGCGRHSADGNRDVMTFLTLLICLLCNHYWLRRRRLSIEAWFSGWYRWLERRSTRGASRWLPHPAVFVLILCVIPVLPLAVLLWAVDGLLLGVPALLIHILVLLHTMPRTNLG